MNAWFSLFTFISHLQQLAPDETSMRDNNGSMSIHSRSMSTYRCSMSIYSRSMSTHWCSMSIRFQMDTILLQMDTSIHYSNSIANNRTYSALVEYLISPSSFMPSFWRRLADFSLSSVVKPAILLYPNSSTP